MRREFFILANVNETQRSSATLSGLNGRQKGKGASRWRRCLWKSYYSAASPTVSAVMSRPKYFMEISLSLPSSRSSAIA